MHYVAKVIVGAAICANSLARHTPLARGNELPILLKERFENGLERWQTTDPDPHKPFWKLVDMGAKQGQALRVTGKSNYEPPYRSPHSIALLKDMKVGDFELTVQVQNTNKTAGPHRDLCLFWGYQDAAHFYYVHLGAKPDPHACQIFIVDGAPRKMITKKRSKGIPWTDGWHTVRVVRDIAGGSMNVYFDEMQTPVMTAVDTKFGVGTVGVGTFDDHGNFDNLILRGRRAE